jgi:hypothetical protein
VDEGSVEINWLDEALGQLPAAITDALARAMRQSCDNHDVSICALLVPVPPALPAAFARITLSQVILRPLWVVATHIPP